MTVKIVILVLIAYVLGIEFRNRKIKKASENRNYITIHGKLYTVKRAKDYP